MSGRHGDVGDDGSPLRLLQTGPIVVRGIARGMRGTLGLGSASRHRGDPSRAEPAPVDAADPTSDDVLDGEAAVPQTPLEAPAVRLDGVDPIARGRAELRIGRDDQEDRDMASRGSTPSGGGGSDGDVPADERAEAGRPSPSAGRRKPARRAPAAKPEEDAIAAAPGTGPSEESVNTAAAAVPGADPIEHPESGAAGEAEGIESPSTTGPKTSEEQPSPATELPPPPAHWAGQDRGVGSRAPALRDRFSREALGIAVLVVLTVVCAALIAAVVVKTRDDAAAAAREAAAYQPPALSTPSPASSGPVVVIVSDEAALRAASGVETGERWPQLLGEDDEVTTVASAGAGYATAGEGERTFVESAARVPADADVVLFVGGAADDEVSALSLARAATQAFSAAAEQAPDATIVAVGPLFRPSGLSEADLGTVRTTLRSAARIADVRWVDPIASGWVTGVAATGDLSASKERVVASRVSALVRAAVG